MCTYRYHNMYSVGNCPAKCSKTKQPAIRLKDVVQSGALFLSALKEFVFNWMFNRV